MCVNKAATRATQGTYPTERSRQATAHLGRLRGELSGGGLAVSHSDIQFAPLDLIEDCRRWCPSRGSIRLSVPRFPCRYRWLMIRRAELAETRCTEHASTRRHGTSARPMVFSSVPNQKLPVPSWNVMWRTTPPPLSISTGFVNSSVSGSNPTNRFGAANRDNLAPLALIVGPMLESAQPHQLPRQLVHCGGVRSAGDPKDAVAQ